MNIQINTFEVKPGRASELAQLLVVAIDDRIRHLPGFVSAEVYVSADGTRILNRIQSETERGGEIDIHRSLPPVEQLADSSETVQFQLRHSQTAPDNLMSERREIEVRPSLRLGDNWRTAP